MTAFLRRRSSPARPAFCGVIDPLSGWESGAQFAIGTGATKMPIFILLVLIDAEADNTLTCAYMLEDESCLPRL